MISVPAPDSRSDFVARLSAIRATVRRLTAPLTRGLHALRREHLLWALLAVALLLFAVVLILEPTAAGRGGR